MHRTKHGFNSRGGNKDLNQKEIVLALRAAGASVLETQPIVRGFPDLLIGFDGMNILCEVKNPNNSYGKRGLNKNQLEWAKNWPTPVYVVRTIPEALDVLVKEQKRRAEILTLATNRLPLDRGEVPF